ncbi:MAG: 6-phosphogluconolactonase [Paracoccaceae bacterium]
MKLREYPDREMMMMTLADILASDLRNALTQRERASFCVPGGTTPGPIFDTLSGVNLEWDRVDVIPSDERWVDESAPRSNMRLVRSRLLTGAAAGARLIPLYADAPEPEDEVEALGALIEPCLPLSVVLLGMGADMHTASMFAGAEGLEAALAPDAPILVPIRAPGQETRVTLSARVLAGALSLHIVITGEDKREALQAAKSLPAHEAPVAAVLAHANVHWAA